VKKHTKPQVYYNSYGVSATRPLPTDKGAVIQQSVHVPRSGPKK